MKLPTTVSDYCSDWYIKEKFVHPKSHTNLRTREEVIASYADLPFDKVEINHSYWDDVDPKTIKRLCDDAGKPIFSYNIFIDLVLPDEQRKVACDQARMLLERAHEMGATHGMMFPALYKEDLPFDEQRKWLVDGLRRCAEIAEDIGMPLICENCDYPPIRVFMGSGKDCADICREVDSPNFRLVCDVCAGLFVNEPAEETFRHMSPYMAHVHLKNSRRVTPTEHDTIERYLDSVDGVRFTGSLLTDGDVDIPHVTRLILESGYKGHLSVEYQGMNDPVDDLRINLAYVEELQSRLG